MQPFEQVVAQDGVVGDAPLQGLFEGAHVVDAFAREDADPKQILVDIGNRVAVQVQHHIASERPGKPIGVGGFRVNGEPWLNHAVAGRHPGTVQDRLVQRVCQHADEGVGAAWR